MCNTNGKENETIRIFTIGFAKKNAREFFTILMEAGIKTVIDVRLNNVSQLAGFTKKSDLEYFLQVIGKIAYIHKPELAPTKGILDAYKKKEIEWAEYEKSFHELLTRRKVEKLVTLEEIDGSCLLCSEPLSDKCHRRLVAEYLQGYWNNINIYHL